MLEGVLHQLRRLSPLWVTLVCSFGGCKPSPSVPATSPKPTRQALARRGDRVLAAAVTIRFSNSGVEPGSNRLGYDRLRVSGVFADADRRDVHLLSELVGPPLQPLMGQPVDTCVRSEGPWVGRGQSNHANPKQYLQLLDIGNLTLSSGPQRLPLRISLVPSLFSAVRGVRYDADVDYGRGWLSQGTLTLRASGGDNVRPMEVAVPVPRPVRITHVGDVAVRGAKVSGVPRDGNLAIRWGSVDGAADLQVWLGAEQGRGIDWIRCRLRDDGRFEVGQALLRGLPKRSARKPWLVVIVRSVAKPVPGFLGSPLRLELLDSVRVM